MPSTTAQKDQPWRNFGNAVIRKAYVSQKGVWLPEGKGKELSKARGDGLPNIDKEWLWATKMYVVI